MLIVPMSKSSFGSITAINGNPGSKPIETAVMVGGALNEIIPSKPQVSRAIEGLKNLRIGAPKKYIRFTS